MRDVTRLMDATKLPSGDLVAWLAPDEVDMTGEPESFVELREGRRLMVLAQREGACVLLREDETCGAYPARPRDCRAFPFHFEVPSAGVRRLTLLPLDGCDHAEDGDQDGAQLEAEDAQRWEELREYQQWVALWNRRVWHRRRLRKGVPSANEFLEQGLTGLETLSSRAARPSIR
jgi:Fe-S-cluster containining protein